MDQQLRARQLHNSGNLECAEGNWAAAIENYALSNAVKDKSKYTFVGCGRTHLCLGRAYYFKGEWESAREQYRRAAKLFDQDPTCSSNWIAQ
jgi:Flp pilus assembly protein TadD